MNTIDPFGVAQKPVTTPDNTFSHHLHALIAAPKHRVMRLRGSQMAAFFPPHEGGPRLELWRTMSPPDDDTQTAVSNALTAVLAVLHPTKRYRITISPLKRRAEKRVVCYYYTLTWRELHT